MLSPRGPQRVHGCPQGVHGHVASPGCPQVVHGCPQGVHGHMVTPRCPQGVHGCPQVGHMALRCPQGVHGCPQGVHGHVVSPRCPQGVHGCPQGVPGHVLSPSCPPPHPPPSGSRGDIEPSPQVTRVTLPCPKRVNAVTQGLTRRGRPPCPQCPLPRRWHRAAPTHPGFLFKVGPLRPPPRWVPAVAPMSPTMGAPRLPSALGVLLLLCGWMPGGALGGTGRGGGGMGRG